jgi:hypothetical protein
MSLVVALIAVFIGIVWSILAARREVRPAQDPWPLFAKPLLTAREAELYQRLEAMYPEHRIFVQVALSQLLEVVPGTRNRRSLRNQFQQLVADFVLCRRDWTVIAVIELDDASHAAANRQHADRRKTKAIESAGLRLVRIPAGPLPSGAALHRMIRPEQLELCTGPPITSDTVVHVSNETVQFVRPVLGMSVAGLAVIAGWFAYSQLLAGAIPKENVSIAVAKTMPRSGSAGSPLVQSVSPVPIQVKDSRQEQTERALAAKQAAEALAKQEEAAWLAYYKAPASCEHPPAWADQVECGNQYMRAKKAFEQQWQAQLAVNGGSQ